MGQPCLHVNDGVLQPARKAIFALGLWGGCGECYASTSVQGGLLVVNW
jgi:hypothetical protein